MFVEICFCFVFLTVLAFLRCGLSKSVTGIVGENIKIPTGLSSSHPDDSFALLLAPSNRILFEFHEGQVRRELPRFHLNTDDRSFTIGPLLRNDSGSYVVQIFQGNGATHGFTLTVHGKSAHGGIWVGGWVKLNGCRDPDNCDVCLVERVPLSFGL